MSTETAQNRSEATPEPLPAAKIAKDALYEAVRRLRHHGWKIVRHAETGSAEIHRDLAPMRDALELADALLYPQPLPESPEGVEVLFARAVRRDDEVFWCGMWQRVDSVLPPRRPTVVVWHLWEGDARMSHTVAADTPLPVRRAEVGQ